MSASITDYFKPKASDTAKTSTTKKRKHPDNDENADNVENIPPQSAESTISTVTTVTTTTTVTTNTSMTSSISEPAHKRMKLNHDESLESKQESDEEDNDDDEDEDMVQDAPPSKSTSASTSTSTVTAAETSKDGAASEAKTETESESKQADTSQPAKAAKDVDISYANCDELLHASWRKVLAAEFEKAYFKQLRKKLAAAHKSGAQIFPPLQHTFRAFEFCPWDELKVVLLGQDPYHDDGQAEGLCFSVPSGIKVPSSLKNMMKEAKTDVGFVEPGHGSLVKWAQQGVLLLNTVLTVQAHKANSHKDFGWQQFTDAVIKAISDKHDGVVFILWGGQAKKKKKTINTKKHKVVEAAHPSGLSAHRGFFGSKPYSKTNAFLKELGKEEINWQT